MDGSVRLCADGGANRLYDGLKNREERLEFLPDEIRGDLDSLRTDVRQFYESCSVPVTKLDDLYSTDLGKCVRYLQELEAKEEGEKGEGVYEIVVYGAIGGRFDQTMATIHALHELTSLGRKVYAMSNESMAVLLRENVKHEIHINKRVEGPTCGLLPIGVTEARCRTSGLKWNLDESMPALSFGKFLSTSNWFEGDEDGRGQFEAGGEEGRQQSAVHEQVVDPHETHASNTPTRVIAIAVDASIVRPETDQIVLLNVRPVVFMPTAYGAIYVDFSSEIANIEEANKKASHDLLRAYAAKLPAHKYNMRGVALRGDPREELEYKTNDVHADMLVIGSRGLGAFKRTFLGSVSDYLVHHLNIPVIVPRAPLEESIKK
ncbi:hypothetical protein HDV05_007933 [Chytridiales sp. JEL 0842]|nr:hypothetical protein HDV05_007933 [Chytridiales sp. JEL 0842]